MKYFSLFPVLFIAFAAHAQTAPVWTMQSPGTHASLRGIHTVDGKVAWASGSGGTVLRTIDGGEHWTQCATPDAGIDGAKLDFRGVQAWDVKTAIVMASGPGELSRIYKTTDGCRTWKLLLKNPDKDGFWDAMYFYDATSGVILGDPVGGRFTIFYAAVDPGKAMRRLMNPGLEADSSTQGGFAASDSLMDTSLGVDGFVTGGKGGAFYYFDANPSVCVDCGWHEVYESRSQHRWSKSAIPLLGGSESTGAYSISKRYRASAVPRWLYLAVGGDYTKPNESAGTAAWSADGGQSWTAAAKPPHGYRSTVEWSEALQAWITAGTNGSDFSVDDGKSWEPLEDGNWNALSLPFLVGPDGRIARLNAAAFREKIKSMKSVAGVPSGPEGH